MDRLHQVRLGRGGFRGRRRMILFHTEYVWLLSGHFQPLDYHLGTKRRSRRTRR
jgi:hypothetical protein